MTLFFHELRRNRLSLIIWTAVLCFMLTVCVVIYPMMESQMANMSEMFANMGEFSEAFNMDGLAVGEFIGYFAVECGEVMGMGGAMFAAMIGIALIGKEEKDRTAEFLLTHPVSRTRIALIKLASALARLVILNIYVLAVTLISVAVIGEEPELKVMLLLFFGYFVMQTLVCCICFGISAFLRNGGIGIGLGFGLILYFISIASNLTDKLEVLKYFTPFSIADGSYIVNNSAIEWKYAVLPFILAIAMPVWGLIKYNRKDIS